MTLEDKLKQALEYLGDKYVFAKNSTFDYKRGPTILGQYKENK